MTADITNAIEVARKFNDAVSSTAVIGQMASEIRAIREDVGEIKTAQKNANTDIRHLRATTDKWGGAIAVMSAALSIAVSVAVAAFS